MTSYCDPAHVLYVDHQGHPVPLNLCFHATASRRLSSTVDRQRRPSTVTQTDSSFCPQCLTFHDASSAAQLGYCPKPGCIQCPLCTSIVACMKVDSCYCYSCGKCDWNSLKCSLKVDSSTAEATKEEAAAALIRLSDMLQERRKASGCSSVAEEYYRKMIAAWDSCLKPIPKSGATTVSFPFKGKRHADDPESWSVEALETELQKKREASAQEMASILGGEALQRISLEESRTLDGDLQGLPVGSLALQALNSASTMSMADLLPLPIPLRSRNSRRCRAELAEGKPGILLKPKLNPLEGDSSLRTGHGQWWKKDSSAVHVVPRVRVIQHGSKTVDNDTAQLHAFVLKVTNSTLGLVRLQIVLASQYKGEPSWNDHLIKNPSLEDLIVETLTNLQVDAFLLTTSNGDDADSILKSDVVILGSAEDSIVDIGKVVETPEQVVNWDAKQAIATASSESLARLKENHVAFLGIKALAEKSGSVWFELICATKEMLDLKPNSSKSFTAFPISLHIEVGKGSWESSLIEANRSDEDEEADKVVFDLVVTWSSAQPTK